MNKTLAAVTAFFGGLVLKYGVLGLAIGMFAESLGVPTASVVLELTAGPLIYAGKTTFIEAVIFATIGLTLGSVVSYYLGYFGADLGKKILNKGGEKVKKRQTKAQKFIRKYGDIGILFAQLFGRRGRGYPSRRGLLSWTSGSLYSIRPSAGRSIAHLPSASAWPLQACSKRFTTLWSGSWIPRSARL